MPISTQQYGEHFGPLNSDRHIATADFEGFFSAGQVVEEVVYPAFRLAVGGLLRVQAYFDAPTTLRIIAQPEPEFFISAMTAIDQPANTGVMLDAYTAAVLYPDTFYYASLVTRWDNLAANQAEAGSVNGNIRFILIRDGSTTNSNEFDVDFWPWFAGSPG